jgi:hypothetical protein
MVLNVGKIPWKNIFLNYHYVPQNIPAVD